MKTLTIAVIAALVVAAPLFASRDEHSEAVAQARRGDFATALPTLERLARTDGGDRRHLHDYLVVLGWAGRHADAVTAADTADLGGAPAYVLEAVARSAREVQRFDLSRSLFLQSIRRHPDRVESRVGLALSLSDQGRHRAAADLLEVLAERHPDRVDVYEARAVVAESASDWIQALAMHQLTLERAPGRRESQRGVLRAAAKLGAQHLAHDLAARDPGLITADELRTLAADRTAISMRWGRIEERIATGDARFHWLSRALADSEEVATALVRDGGAAARADRVVRQLLNDRVVALNWRHSNEQAVALYERLLAAGLEPPAYTQRAAADAYLAVRQPERAAALYASARREIVDDFNLELAYFFALGESERHDDAIAQIDALAARTPARHRDGRPNHDAQTARAMAALARVFTERPAQAETMAAKVIEDAPYSAESRALAASVAQARGWPRRADEEYQRALATDPESAGLRAERIGPLLELHEFAAARSELDRARAERPDDARVKRAADVWAVHASPELYVDAGYARSTTASPTGARDWRVDTWLYSAPLAHRWRAFAHTYNARATIDGTGIGWNRMGAGAEYRARDLRLTAEANAGSGAPAGLAVSGRWQPDDHWRLSAQGQSVSNSIPLRAWLQGIRANELGTDAQYAVNESRRFSGGLGRLGFSDGNTRRIASANWNERWITGPRFKLETNLGVWHSRNSRDGAPYFNPARDTSATLEVAGEWTTWRSYENNFKQRLAIGAGRYWQQGFASGPVWTVRYDHAWEFDRRVALRYGIGRLLQPYDGVGTGRTFFSLTLDWRFL